MGYGVIGLLLWPPTSTADVDAINANYSLGLSVDVGPIEGTGFGIAYNSRSRYNGLFGFGWCSDLETRLDIKLNGDFEMVDCGAGSSIRFGLPNPGNRVNSAAPDLAEVISRRGGGKVFTKFMTDEKVELDSAANVRQLLKEGVTAEELLEMVGLKAPTLGAGEYRGDDGSTASFDGAIVRVARIGGQRRTFNASGALLEQAEAAGNRLAIVTRSANVLVFDVRGVRATLEFNAEGRAERLRVGDRTVANFGYVRIGRFATLDSIQSGRQSASFQYDDWVNLVARRESGRVVERIKYDQSRDWALSTEDTESGCTNSFLYGTGVPPKIYREVEQTLQQTFQQALQQRLRYLAKLQRYPTDNNLVAGDVTYTLTERTCKDHPKVTVGAQAYAYAKNDVGAQFQAASTSWFETAGTSFVEYAPGGDLRAVTQPPLALRSSVRKTIDAASLLMTNSMFSVDYVQPSDCEQALRAQGVILLREPSQPVLFQARARRAAVHGECVITSIEWQTAQGKVRIAVERDSKGASNAVVIDGGERWRHAASPDESEPSACSLREASQETEPKQIAARVNAALSATCPKSLSLTHQAALVFSLIQSQYTCSCESASVADHKVADFARWIVRGEFIRDPALNK